MNLNLNEYNPIAAQGVMNFFIYIILGIVGLLVLVLVLKKVIEAVSFKYFVEINDNYGEGEVNYLDKASEVKLGDDFRLKYHASNTFSPIYHPKYLKLFKGTIFGFIPVTKPGFYGYKMGKSIFPIESRDNPGLVPVNVDFFEYIEKRAKVESNARFISSFLLKMSPLLAFLGVCIFLVFGLFLYSKHVETIVTALLEAAAK